MFTCNIKLIHIPIVYKIAVEGGIHYKDQEEGGGGGLPSQLL